MKLILLLNHSDQTQKKETRSRSLFAEGEAIKIDGHAEFLVLETQEGTSKYGQIVFVSPPISM